MWFTYTLYVASLRVHYFKELALKALVNVLLLFQLYKTSFYHSYVRYDYDDPTILVIMLIMFTYTCVHMILCSSLSVIPALRFNEVLI